MSEKFIFQSKKFENAEITAAAFAKAQKIIARDAIDIASFRDIYGPERIKVDEAYVAKREQEFSEKNTSEDSERLRMGLILEAILHEHGEQSNWFGEKAVTIKTSRFDDIAHGVDEVVEFQEETQPASYSYLALAVDATASKDTDRKIEEILAEIRRGSLARVDYFEAENLGMKGQLSGIPHVVAGADANTVLDLANLWIEGKTAALAKHPVQFQILEEILEQCQKFAKFAETIGQAEISRKYAHTGEIIESILAEKKTKITDSGKRDKAYTAINQSLKSIPGV